jgi:Xaa-Pro dipeptidase
MAILHFSEDELAQRRQRACEKMAVQGLDAVLLFKQESMYYLTGYDTGGYSLFQCLILRADGDLVLVTRSADKLQAGHTSMIPDVRIWIDKGGANPAHDVVAVLKEKGLAGKQVGVELHAWCLTGQRWEMVRHALDGFCSHSDATDLIQGLRLIKSPAEMAYVRKAGTLCDDALKALNHAIEPGVDEGILYSRMMQAILEGGGDPAASRPIIGSGDGAMLVRYFTGREKVGAQDQVQLEYGAGYRHYHVAIMRTVLTGVAGERHKAMHAAGVEALAACQEVARPGATYADIYEAHARVVDAHGLQDCRLNACGYSLSANFPPSWMEEPMIYPGNTTVIEPGMVIFMHMILVDSANMLTMSLGETGIMHEDHFESVSSMPHDLVVK